MSDNNSEDTTQNNKKQIERPSRVLAVDDDRIILMMLEAKLQEQGYDVIKAVNGKEACDILQKEKHNIEVILLDREMPEMDGMQVVEWMKKSPELSKIPIIMQTGSCKPEQVKEGIDAGVFYYLTKPLDEDVLKSVLVSAIRESKKKKTLRSEMKRHGTSFNLMQNSKYTLRTLNEAEDLACFLANCFPDPDRVLVGLAELFVNAVEHGNLEISYDEKTELINQGNWLEEIDKRIGMVQYSSRKVDVLFKKTEDSYKVKVIDEGKGFEWKKYMKIDPSRAMDNHGRGIALANMMSFDSLKYNDIGNEVVATVDTVSQEKPLDW